MEMAALSDDGTLRYISISDGTLNNRIVIGYSNSDNNFINIFKAGGVSIITELNIPIVQTDISKIAFKWKTNDYALWINGIEVFTENVGVSFPINTLDRMQFANGDGINSPLFAKVKQLKVFKTALTDQQLTDLTT